MKERIEAIIQSERLTPSQFADAIGVQRSGISHILSGRNKPSLDFLTKLLNRFPHISGDWLITGNGSMTTNKQLSGTVEQLSLTSEESMPKKPLKVPKPRLKEEPPAEYTTNAKRSSNTPQSIIGTEDKAIERIVVFYKDRTFKEYKPE